MLVVSRRHIRNPQGEGRQLRQEILAAAGRILETTGSDDAVTLRAVAREAGITAPAIYAHFADRDAIRITVITDTFAELAAVMTSVYDTHDDPVERLHALGHTYLNFAADHPHHYRLLFERHRAAQGEDAGPAAPDTQSIVGADAFGALVQAVTDCIESESSDASDPIAAATRVWIGLHGHATLRASLPWFPWPDSAALTDDLIRRLANL